MSYGLRHILQQLAFVLTGALIAALNTADLSSILAFLSGTAFVFLPELFKSKRTAAAVTILFATAAVFAPPLCFYLPLAAYRFARLKYSPRTVLFVLIPLVITSPGAGLYLLYALICLLALLAYSLCAGTEALRKTEDMSIEAFDSERGRRFRLEAETMRLAAEKQAGIRLATLAERNRIARELHDTIGHVIASSLLQTSALLSTVEGEAEKKALIDLKKTLDVGMDRARKSVHRLYEESLDFGSELKEMCDVFTFCELTSSVLLQEEPPYKVRETILKAVGEALTNVARHSDATLVEITVDEWPSHYRLKVADNGTKRQSREDGGIHLGLMTMRERAARLGGRLFVRNDDGFIVIMILPKQLSQEADTAKDAGRDLETGQPAGHEQR